MGASGTGAAAGSSFGPAGAGIGAGIGAFMGVVDAMNTNRAIKSANAAAIKADAANKAYIDLSRQSSQSKLGKEIGKYLGREAVLSSARGTYGSSSSSAAQLSALANALVDSAAIDFNARAQKNQSASAIGNQIRQNMMNYQNPIFSGIRGGMGMAQSGYNLGRIFGG